LIKVCILTSVHPPFDGRIFHKEAVTLVKSGYDVVLIAQHDSEEIVNGVRIVPLPHPKNRFERVTKVTWKLLTLALKERADIYHFHDPELLPVCVLLKLCTRAKFIYDVHEHYPNAITHRFWIPKWLRQITAKLFSLFERISVRFFNFIIYTTHPVGERYVRMKIPSEKIENYPLTDLARSFKRDPKEHIIYLGGMSRIRGTLELIKAFSIVIERHPEWQLILLGKTSPAVFSNEVEDLIHELEIGDSVQMISWVPYEEKERYSSQASIGVVTYLPYANHICCLPNKLFDYMLVGIPVICSNFDIYREIVEGNECGLTVDPTDPEEIARAIMFMIEHPDEAAVMGENGRRAIARKYNWENEGKRLLNLYSGVLSDG
jgi:glycosyltransferase involved in cell wall biosynthesis